MTGQDFLEWWYTCAHKCPYVALHDQFLYVHDQMVVPCISRGRQHMKSSSNPDFPWSDYPPPTFSGSPRRSGHGPGRESRGVESLWFQKSNMGMQGGGSLSMNHHESWICIPWKGLAAFVNSWSNSGTQRQRHLNRIKTKKLWCFAGPLWSLERSSMWNACWTPLGGSCNWSCVLNLCETVQGCDSKKIKESALYCTVYSKPRTYQQIQIKRSSHQTDYPKIC